MWAAEGYYDLLGTTFHIRAQDPGVGAEVDRLLAPFRRAKTGVPGRRRYSLVTSTPSNTDRPSLFRDCSLAGSRPTWDSVLGTLLTQLNRAALEEFTGFAVHAGVVADGARVVAFPAVSGSGKTTMASACVLAGFDYVSDEALCLDYGTRRVRPYAKPAMLSGESRRLLGLAVPPGPFDPGEGEAAVTAGDLGGVVAGGELGLTDVVVLDRSPVTAPVLHPLPGSEVLATLLRLSFNHYKRPREAFELVSALAGQARAWRLEYDEPRAAAELVRDRLAVAVSPGG